MKYLVFLNIDVSKAFDTLLFGIMLYKLKYYESAIIKNWVIGKWVNLTKPLKF